MIEEIISGRFLQRHELEEVDPDFRQMVVKAWANQENVPYEITTLSSIGMTQEDIQCAKELFEFYQRQTPMLWAR